MNRQERFEADQREWLALQFDDLTHEIQVVSPSKWAETNRYLPPSVTPLPGYYDFGVAPYIREILDCMGVECPIREVAVMKGGQVCFTTGVLENTIGYFIDHVKTAAILMVTADADLALLRLESYITPMLEHSGLMDQIQSADPANKRKTGRTNKKIEWVGGGSLVPFGAQNASKFRSLTAQVILDDEVDGWPDTVGDDGDPVKLIRDRAVSYEDRRKILDMSTPLIKGQSKIHDLFKRGDQRYYEVKCLRCFHPQVLRWRRENSATGEVTGMSWQMDGDRVVPGSARYLCSHCGHPHSNHDKTKLMAPDNAEWVPTAVPVSPDVRSYHLSALYSPVGMQSWDTLVLKWLEAWDVEKSRSRDNAKLQVFYNNVLGEPFELRGERLRFENVSAHRRSDYRFGEVPNKFASSYCGGPVQLLTCAVDVHKESLKVTVFGWCVDRRALLIDYHTLEGDPEQLDDPGTWGALRDIIENREYTADDGKVYRLAITLIDSGDGNMTDQVYRFCDRYELGVFPLKGTGVSAKSARIPYFTEFRSPNGTLVYGITVDLYKDRWSASLRRGWDGGSLQPHGHFNAPSDVTDKQLKELTVEVKREKIEKSTGKRIGFEWHRPSGAANELWDLLVYANAALDLLAWNVSKMAGLESTNWVAFWDECQDPNSAYCNYYTDG